MTQRQCSCKTQSHVDAEADTGATWPRVQRHWHPGKPREAGRKDLPRQPAQQDLDRESGLRSVRGSTVVLSHAMWLLVTAAQGANAKLLRTTYDVKMHSYKNGSVITTMIKK